jgi:hypothetical protein
MLTSRILKIKYEHKLTLEKCPKATTTVFFYNKSIYLPPWYDLGRKHFSVLGHNFVREQNNLAYFLA